MALPCTVTVLSEKCLLAGCCMRTDEPVVTVVVLAPPVVVVFLTSGCLCLTSAPVFKL
jgi:hypothetical protein